MLHAPILEMQLPSICCRMQQDSCCEAFVVGRNFFGCGSKESILRHARELLWDFERNSGLGLKVRSFLFALLGCSWGDFFL